MYNKNVTKSEEKKLPNSIKLDPLSCPLIPVIFMKRCTRSIIFVMFCWKLKIENWKLSNSWIYLWKNFLEIHWRCLQNIVLQNPKKIFEKIFSLKFVQVGYKRPKSFFQINIVTCSFMPASLNLQVQLSYF